MTLANEADRVGRFIHEILHEIADDEDVLEHCVNIDTEEAREGVKNLVAIIVNKWEAFREEYETELSS